MASGGPTVLCDDAVPDVVDLLDRRGELGCIAPTEVLCATATWSV